ncbi:MAG: bifunctional (p)ppGpp synthetase/guanosine-3',5'-bis(diphosphate) 3'-pyrophosphohydrolase [Deltaproteobacteria bacterium]|nr:bifunctional (p)ppGpp synthetase/guanosine-3',5'-bis(diphosphate) 3'-pyrophosphohydrolase [Deltaproteobacteria bacterium]
MIPDISEIIKTIRKNFPECDESVILKAWDLAEKHHRNEARISGEPYIVHPYTVSKITAEMGLDEEPVAAALLHDMHNDEKMLSTLSEKLPGFIPEVVRRLGVIRTVHTRNLSERDKENYRKYILSVAGDLRVILIKIADRLDNMRTLDSLPEDEQIRVAGEVRSLYVPLANRMGLNAIKSELENLCFYYLEHDDYLNLENGVKKISLSAGEYVDNVVHILKEKLSGEGIEPTVYGRTKHLYSIHMKMVQKKKTLDDINDILAFRIKTDSESQCYTALGVIHAAFKPITGTFKDYIALPKQNGYQSLHTAVIGPGGRRIEIQIRTDQMHQIAEKGIAAHWLYKERFKKTERRDAEKFSELRKTADHLTARVDEGFWSLSTFQQEIFTFTPDDKLIVMKKGATALDFAFNVHTQIGYHCTGTKVNGVLVPLKTVLKNGDRVEVSTHTNQKPSSDWLKFAVTSKALNKIKHHIRNEERAESRRKGRDILEKDLRKKRMSLPKLMKDGTLRKISSELRFSTPDDVFLAIGEGKLESEKVINAICPEEDPVEIPEKIEKKKKKKKKSGIPVEVDGISNMLVRFAGCCSPITGDPIRGYITRGRGITIHHSQCPKIRELESERLVNAKWLADTLEGEPFILKVVTDDKSGVLVKLSDTFAKQNINIRRIFTETLRSSRTAVYFHFNTTKNNCDLLVRNLRKIRGVHGVSRTNTSPL